jgi:PPP family 3-phenylpropionic acid transporter
MIKPPAFAASRLALFYATHFAVIGVVLPFWPVWLEDRGLTAREIGTVLALGMVMKVVGNPLFAQIADRHGSPRGVMVALAAASLAAFALFETAHGFWPLFAVSALFFTVWPATLPLGESLTMRTARAHDLDYGRIRLWGSITFICMSALTGWVLKAEPVAAVFWMALVVIALKVPVCAALPAQASPKAPRDAWLVMAVFRVPGFWMFLAAGALIQSSHAVYYGFGTLHWLGAGIDEQTVGWLWAEGVIAEIILFALGGRLLARLGPVGLLALGGAAALLRWPALALGTDLAVLATVQALHAFTFGATHLGAVHFIARMVPPDLSATAQAVYAAVVMGLAFGPAMLAAGALFDAVGAAAYGVMALMGAGGFVLALALARRMRAFPPVP